ncbi:hypothetical protein MTR_7g446150 [Medicago truncatula]|uniref:Uncharacterized protein n=1 Tax=Medicago truncatula TaxID=3880 RepID=A0A072TZ13_MEDTR|nr:hypothetical protein MTR_7g446150 [Medicago truncatula]
MLGKQGYKFHTKTDCLVSKLFKERYFPRNDYFRAKLGHNPSFEWHSIFSARQLVRLKIGNGLKIPIFDAPWLKDGSCISGEGHPRETSEMGRNLEVGSPSEGEEFNMEDLQRMLTDACQIT